jgi:hypothetical protein
MCGKRRKPKNRECCRQCRKKQNEARRVENPRQPFDKPLHQRNKEARLCTLGGAKHDRPQEGHTLCDACMKRKRQRYQARIKKRQCKLCSNPATPGKRLCDTCRENRKQQRLTHIANGLCAECGKEATEAGRKLCPGCLVNGKLKDKKKRDRLRDLVFAAYGGYCCVCCGETEPLFLHIDHINNDGARHRREILGGKKSSGQSVYRWLRVNGFPPGFQVLCANCNLGKHRNGGVCPHQVNVA